MRKCILLAVAAAVLLLPATSRAQVRFGARAGYGFGTGAVGNGTNQSDWLKAQIPIQLEALYRFNPNLAFGPYVSYGFARPGGPFGDSCGTAGETCSSRVFRLGFEAMYTFALEGTYERFSPWLGAGLGFEWSRLEEHAPAGDYTTTATGLEILSLQGGLDWVVNEKLAAGPFLMISFGRYDDASATNAFGTVNGLQDKAIHEWIQLGLRVRFDP